MAASQPKNRRALVWAVVGAAIIVGAIIAIIASGLFADSTAPAPTQSPSTTADPSIHPSAEPAGATVDPSVTDNGWIPEPITTDRDTYTRAALAAASTFDTQLSSRNDWLSYLDTWFTPDTRYVSQADRDDDMAASQLELRQAVVLPESEWDSLANEDGRVAASVPGRIDYTDVPDDESSDMSIATADVLLTFTRSDGVGNDASYDETVRVSVQVLCGDESVPTPNSDQQAGDCKVVRYFSGTLEH
ncbi:hypothetical protein [Microbacterium marmarense]|uniref:Uncharacterized protein n=1 Tax=Microbacterium marmarense TaxID=3122051 RepID=A0ABU8LQU5_9MICO